MRFFGSIRNLRAPAWSISLFAAGAIFSTVVSLAVPNLWEDFNNWLRPPYIEACSSLAKSEVTVFRETGEVGLTALYPVDNHFYFYFQNRTGSALRNPRIYLDLSGYNGKAPEISKMAVLVSSIAAQQSAVVDVEGKRVTIDLDVLPVDATVLFEMLVWEPIDANVEVVLEDGVQEFFQPADCAREITELVVRNFEPVFHWVDQRCEAHDWGSYCPRPNVTGVVDVYPGESLSMQFDIVSKGQFIDAMSATVQFASHPQLISEALSTRLQVYASDFIERDENGDIAVATPAFDLNVIARDESQLSHQ